MADVLNAIAKMLHGFASLLLLASRGVNDLANNLHGGYLVGAVIFGIFMWASRPAWMRRGADK